MIKFYRLLSALLFLGISTNSYGQWGTPGSSTDLYANHWIKFDGRPYVKIGVKTKGIQRVNVASLPTVTVNTVSTAFATAYPDFSRYQLWHRGKEVAIISADASGIVFYGEPNDGAQDSLLYRPVTSRLNKHYSLYSEIGAYFLTVVANGEGAPKRAAQSNIAYSPDYTFVSYHLKSVSTTFSDRFSVSTQNGSRGSDASPLAESLPGTSNAFFDYGKGWTGADRSTGISVPFNFSMPLWQSSNSIKPTLEILLYGRVNLGVAHQIDIYSAPSALNVPTDRSTYATNRLEAVNIYDFNGFKKTFILDKDIHIGAGGNGVITTKSVTNDPSEKYSVSYYTLTYPANFDQQSAESVTYTLPRGGISETRSINISNVPTSSKVYDITDPTAPTVITTSTPGSISIPSIANRIQKLLVGTFEATNSSVNSVTFNQINPADYNYLIVTNRTLKAAGQLYGQYRSEAAGGRYKPLVIEIEDIYNQFNFGEPSPIAIKRFVSYMISNSLDKYLLLIGKSVTTPFRIRLEMDNEVPSMGDPASDVLLTAGLRGVNEDLPAIPVGRISTRSHTEVINYLNKVKKYEADTESLSWRKEVLHITGEKTLAERNNQFGVYFNNVSGFVTAEPFAGHITTINRPGTEPWSEAATKVNIYDYLNYDPIANKGGVGFISYFGHGTWTSTATNIGLLTNNNAPLANPFTEYTAPASNKRFPVMYITGCGVGNDFFLKNQTQTYTALGADWILAENKGAVALIAASFNNWTSSSEKHLNTIYPLIFSTTDGARATLGRILSKTAEQIVLGTSGAKMGANSRSTAASTVDIANIHITVLFGDPALRFLNAPADNVLPVNLVSFKGTAIENAISLSWKTTGEHEHKEFLVERSRDSKTFQKIGSVAGSGQNKTEESLYTFEDGSPLFGTNYYRLKQIDLNGDFSYSKIIAVDYLKKSEDIFLSPNPANGSFSIVNKSSNQIKSWELRTMSGISLEKGTSLESNKVKNIQPGIYLLHIALLNGESVSKKMIIE